MSDYPPKLPTPAPPKTKSGEVPAVRTFREEVEKYTEGVPQAEAQVDRMTELFNQVTGAPGATDRVETPIPKAPRPASFVDPSELEEPEDEKEKE